ncbi:MAG: hypothetical protein KFF77_12310, partial [Bacteroidetes bacterium]|nr:hypothetical protein [Bacteroidota bacterium]
VRYGCIYRSRSIATPFLAQHSGAVSGRGRLRIPFMDPPFLTMDPQFQTMDPQLLTAREAPGCDWPAETYWTVGTHWPAGTR